MQTAVLDTIAGPALRMYVIWVPILPEDSEGAARESSALVPDARAAHFWDAERALPELFSTLLALPEGWPAWDVYLAYARGVAWPDMPPEPSFWHHQLGEEPDAPVLDGATFAAGVRALSSGG